MNQQVSGVRGMHDILPDTVAAWQFVEKCIRDVMHSYSYLEMRTPLLERTALFQRGIGEATDIVEKEMYTFPDRKGENLTLRPENTAGCVRAAIKNGLMTPGSSHRLWYLGPMFRYERPQKGRTRQFHQVGAEVYGVAGPEIEVELLLLSRRLWQLLGIDDKVQLEINTLGSAAERAQHREHLVGYFQAHEADLDDDSQRRLVSNPLRILDSKNPDMQALIEAAPRLTEFLGDASRAHFDALQQQLSACGIEPVLNPRLVRGLDYYSHTVFEWTTDLLGAQATICGGGRYDGLVDELGGKSNPAVGWASGLERLTTLVQEQVAERIPTMAPDVFVVVSDDVDAAAGIQLSEQLRQHLPALRIQQNPTRGSIKSQFKRADKSGAALAVVLGAAELADNTVTVKPLLDKAEQVQIPRDQLAAAIAERLAATIN